MSLSLSQSLITFIRLSGGQGPLNFAYSAPNLFPPLSISLWSIYVFAYQNFTYSVYYFLIGLISLPNQQTLPVIAIANYGPHSSLNDTINALNSNWLKNIENKTVRYVIKDVDLIACLSLKCLCAQAQKPQLLVTLTTPVSQMAKSLVKTPQLFSQP